MKQSTKLIKRKKALIKITALAYDNVSLEKAINELMSSARDKYLIIEWQYNQRELTKDERSIVNMM